MKGLRRNDELCKTEGGFSFRYRRPRSVQLIGGVESLCEQTYFAQLKIKEVPYEAESFDGIRFKQNDAAEALPRQPRVDVPNVFPTKTVTPISRR